jgi:triphosphatase
MSREIELKYVFTKPCSYEQVFSLPEIAGISGEVREIEMHTIYYDTADFRLSSQGISIRLRRENEKGVVTVKTALGGEGALSLRGEWQVPAGDLFEAIPALVNAGAPELLLHIKPAEMIERARVQFVRHEAALCIKPGFSATISLDEGHFLKNGREMPFSELEIELMEGSAEELSAFGELLCTLLPLRAEPRSKLARALNL